MTTEKWNVIYETSSKYDHFRIIVLSYHTISYYFIINIFTIDIILSFQKYFSLDTNESFTTFI